MSEFWSPENSGTSSLAFRSNSWWVTPRWFTALLFCSCLVVITYHWYWGATSLVETPFIWFEGAAELEDPSVCKVAFPGCPFFNSFITCCSWLTATTNCLMESCMDCIPSSIVSTLDYIASRSRAWFLISADKSLLLTPMTFWDFSWIEPAVTWLWYQIMQG